MKEYQDKILLEIKVSSNLFQCISNKLIKKNRIKRIKDMNKSDISTSPSNHDSEDSVVLSIECENESWWFGYESIEKWVRMIESRLRKWNENGRVNEVILYTIE